nr:hypothetical protein [Tanacetum cinerariifolium]
SPDTKEQSRQHVMTREEEDGISVALDPQTLSSGFCVSTEWEVVFLGGTMLAKVILVKGNELPTIVKVLPVGFHLNPTSVNTCLVGFDPQLLVEHFNPVRDNTCMLESDVVDDSTCLMLLKDSPDTKEQSRQHVMTREEEDGISVALDPQTLSSGFCVSTEWEVVFLGGTMLAKVILVKGNELPTIVKVLPVGFHLNPTSVNTCLVGFDPQLLVEHFNPVRDNTCMLESDVVDDSTCLMLLKDVNSKSLSKGCFALACLTIP